jgi:hypothetical protein
VATFTERCFIRHCCNNLKFYLNEDIARGNTTSEIEDSVSTDSKEIIKWGYDYKGKYITNLMREFKISLETNEKNLPFMFYMEAVLDDKNGTIQQLQGQWELGFEKISTDGEIIYTTFSQMTLELANGAYGKDNEQTTAFEFTMTRNADPKTVNHVHIGFQWFPSDIEAPFMTATVAKNTTTNVIEFTGVIITDTDDILAEEGHITLFDAEYNVLNSFDITQADFTGGSYTTPTVTNIALVKFINVSFGSPDCPSAFEASVYNTTF